MSLDQVVSRSGQISDDRPNNDNNPKIIGGMFGLGRNGFYNDLPPFLKGKSLLLANARSGIALLERKLAPSQIWFPSYLCDVMLRAVTPRKENRTQIRFYGINYELEISSLEWVKEVQEGDLVVFIDYFGFPYDKRYVIEAKRKGAWVLEDASQALLSVHIGEDSDFVLYSPRKWIGVPDGGILVINDEDMSSLLEVELEKPPAEWWLDAFSAAVLRREFDLFGGNRQWFQLFRQADVDAPIGAFAMSELSQMLLRYGFDYSSIAQKRIENYRALDKILGDYLVFPSLPEGVVPLGFPIRVKNRDHVRQKLFGHNIYPPVHWPIPNVVPEEFIESHQLAEDIMTLVCDQRYDPDDMKRMAKVVLQEVQR
jgi:hypothetical protein